MADGTLTFQEFIRLPSERERCERYKDLSDHDKFLARCSQPNWDVSVLCNSCRYKIPGKFACKAFPENIPGEYSDRVDDDPTIECAPGIHYEPKGSSYNSPEIVDTDAYREQETAIRG